MENAKKRSFIIMYEHVHAEGTRHRRDVGCKTGKNWLKLSQKSPSFKGWVIVQVCCSGFVLAVVAAAAAGADWRRLKRETCYLFQVGKPVFKWKRKKAIAHKTASLSKHLQNASASSCVRVLWSQAFPRRSRKRSEFSSTDSRLFKTLSVGAVRLLLCVCH